MADATALAAPEAAAQASRARRVLASFARNRLAVAGVIVLAIVMISALLAPWVSPYDPLKMVLLNPYAPPGSPGHALGTDNFGRDILARLIHGSRISLLIGVVVVSIAASFGTVLGLLAGYLGGWVDEVVMRAVEILYAFPFLVLAIAVIAVFGPSIF